MTTMTPGNDSKDSKYLALMVRRIALDRGHPRHRGIKMQAHHILSGEGVKASGIGTKLVQLGYDINDAKNLAFLPCTLKGACHLGIQPHRGNHTAPVDVAAKAVGRPSQGDNQDSYDDDDHPMSYHKMVARELSNLEMSIDKRCRGNAGNAPHVLKEMMDDLSQLVLMRIYGKPNLARLTNIADAFLLGKAEGCAGVNNVGDHRRSQVPCPSGRNHLNQDGITFESAGRYIPKPGK